jgi:hypothetical protein
MKNKVFFLELNEFNLSLLQISAEKFSLKNLQKVLSFYSIETATSDTYESDFLEPWVQWVCVHTGTASAKHRIKHLGDVPDLAHKQLWEELSERGVTSGIWGAMNASKGSADKSLFFLPDPWTDTENAFPNELNVLLDPIRHLSKNYLHRSNYYLFKKLLGLIKLIFSNRLFFSFLKEILILFYNIIRFRAKSFVFISFYDYISTLLFLKYKKKKNPDFSILFLNSLAHLQHHHWKDLDPSKNPPLKYGLKYIDRILGKIIKGLEKNEFFLIANAFSQKNTNEDAPWILYRPKDQSEFLKAIGVEHTKVEALMTHDAHIYFKDKEEAKRGKKILSSVKVLKSKLFLVEDYKEEEKKLFYRICFTDILPNDAKFVVGDKHYPFFKFFHPIVQRTGKHTQQGTLLSNRNLFIKKIQNYEIYNLIRGLF